MSLDAESRESAFILVIDDEKMVQSVVRRTLLSRGFDNVLTASDGHEALEILRRQRVELVLLDLHMPAMSGRTALREMLRLDPDLTVVVVSAEDDPEILARCMELGAVNCLLKPVPAGVIVHAVHRALQSKGRRAFSVDEGCDKPLP